MNMMKKLVFFFLVSSIVYSSRVWEISTCKGEEIVDIYIRTSGDCLPLYVSPTDEEKSYLYDSTMDEVTEYNSIMCDDSDPGSITTDVTVVTDVDVSKYHRIGDLLSCYDLESKTTGTIDVDTFSEIYMTKLPYFSFTILSAYPDLTFNFPSNRRMVINTIQSPSSFDFINENGEVFIEYETCYHNDSYQYGGRYKAPYSLYNFLFNNIFLTYLLYVVIPCVCCLWIPCFCIGVIWWQGWYCSRFFPFRYESDILYLGCDGISCCVISVISVYANIVNFVFDILTWVMLIVTSILNLSGIVDEWVFNIASIFLLQSVIFRLFRDFFHQLIYEENEYVKTYFQVNDFVEDTFAFLLPFLSGLYALYGVSTGTTAVVNVVLIIIWILKFDNICYAYFSCVCCPCAPTRIISLGRCISFFLFRSYRDIPQKKLDRLLNEYGLAQEEQVEVKKVFLFFKKKKKKWVLKNNNQQKKKEEEEQEKIENEGSDDDREESSEKNKKKKKFKLEDINMHNIRKSFLELYDAMRIQRKYSETIQFPLALGGRLDFCSKKSEKERKEMEKEKKILDKKMKNMKKFTRTVVGAYDLMTMSQMLVQILSLILSFLCFLFPFVSLILLIVFWVTGSDLSVVAYVFSIIFAAMTISSLSNAMGAFYTESGMLVGGFLQISYTMIMCIVEMIDVGLNLHDEFVKGPGLETVEQKQTSVYISLLIINIISLFYIVLFVVSVIGCVGVYCIEGYVKIFITKNILSWVSPISKLLLKFVGIEFNETEDDSVDEDDDDEEHEEHVIVENTSEELTISSSSSSSSDFSSSSDQDEKEIEMDTIVERSIDRDSKRSKSKKNSGDNGVEVHTRDRRRVLSSALSNDVDDDESSDDEDLTHLF